MTTLKNILFLLLFCLLIDAAPAQVKLLPFDPVPFFSHMKIGQEWADGMFFTPAHTIVSYPDSILDGAYVIGLTMRVADPDSAGWKVTLYFDADRYGTLRLMRAQGYCEHRQSDPRGFRRLAAWIDTVMQKKIGERRMEANSFIWPWKQKEEYRLVLGCALVGAIERTFLTLDASAEQ